MPALGIGVLGSANGFFPTLGFLVMTPWSSVPGLCEAILKTQTTDSDALAISPTIDGE